MGVVCGGGELWCFFLFVEDEMKEEWKKKKKRKDCFKKL